MKTVLITGATGAVGSALTPLFLRDPDTKVCILLRAESEAHLGERIRALREFLGIEGRIEALRGDVSCPGLGLPVQEMRRLSSEVTHFVHAAGSVRLDQTPEAARASAVEGLQNVIELARTCSQLVKLDVISTVGVAGRQPGLVPETRIMTPGRFRNTYEAAKAEAEGVLLKSGMPFTLYRPSMVVGDSATGRIIHFQVFYHLAEFLTGRWTGGLGVESGSLQLDIVPADYVARAIHLASGRADTAGRIFHLCLGSAAPTITDLSQRLRGIFQAWGLSIPEPRRVTPPEFERLIPQLAAEIPPEKRRALQALPHFLAYLDTEQVFDNRLSVEYFSGLGLDLPSLDRYLTPVMEYYRRSKSESLRKELTHAGGQS